MWVELEDGTYMNLGRVFVLEAFDAGGGVWKVASPSNSAVAGISETSEAAAQDAIRRLVHGVDAASVI